MIGNHSFFIESRKLGILWPQIQAATNAGPWGSKQMRPKFNRFARIINDLSLIPSGYKIIGISSGIKSDGAIGVFVNVETSTKIQGEVLP